MTQGLLDVKSVEILSVTVAKTFSDDKGTDHKDKLLLVI